MQGQRLLVATDENESMEEINCALCGSSEQELLFYARDDRFGLSTEQFCVVKCLSCGLKYLNPRPTRVEIGRFYPQGYSSGREVWDAEKFRLLGLNSLCGNLLDVGCAKGSFLKFMRQRGWSVCGVEPSSDAAAVARQ